MRRDEDWISGPYDKPPLIMIPTIAADRWEGYPSHSYQCALAVWGYIGIIMIRGGTRCIVLNDIPMPTTVAQVDGFPTIVRSVYGPDDYETFAQAIERCRYSDLTFVDQLMYHEGSEFVIFSSEYRLSEAPEKLYIKTSSSRFYIRTYIYNPTEEISAVLHPLIPLPPLQ